jgi:hypothetical protein
MFFKGRVNYEWEFHWTSIRQRLKLIFTRFIAWQKNPKLYEREVKPRAKVKPMMV